MENHDIQKLHFKNRGGSVIWHTLYDQFWQHIGWNNNNKQHPTHKNGILLLILWNNGFQWIKIDKVWTWNIFGTPTKMCVAFVLLLFLADCFAFGKNVWCANILKCFCCCYRCLLLQHSWIFEEFAFFITPLLQVVLSVWEKINWI